jgi:acyl-CoA thioesterase
MDPLTIVREKFSNDAFANQFGIVLDDLTATTVHMHMELRPEFCNFYGRPHGGAIYALADAAFSVIGNNSNNLSVALESSINYHASPDPDQILHVDGHRIHETRHIGVFLFTIYTEDGENQNLVATMKSTLYRTGKAIQAEE